MVKNLPRKLTFWEHIAELRLVVIRIGLTISIVSIFFFVFGVREGYIFGYRIVYPYPDIVNNIPNHLFLQMKLDLLPTNLDLFPLKLIHPILTNIQISLFLGIVCSTPMIFIQIGYFVGPALFKKEKRMLKWITIPATILFVTGCLFSYYILTPWLIKFMYMYIISMETVPMVSISDFIGFVLMINLAFGIIFELPVFMIGFTKIGIISADFWKKHWRIAAVIMAVVGAIITPDGTGITMMIVAIPMWLLYLFGYLGARYVETRKLKIQ
jgi:sec-independent protein translocase protein TatC